VTGRIRVEVEDRHGVAAEVFDPPALAPRQRDQLAALAGGLVHDVAQALGRSEEHARLVILAVVMRSRADEAAYERVAESRGLLPL
jgi:hypothetical protein